MKLHKSSNNTLMPRRVLSLNFVIIIVRRVSLFLFFLCSPASLLMVCTLIFSNQPMKCLIHSVTRPLKRLRSLVRRFHHFHWPNNRWDFCGDYALLPTLNSECIYGKNSDNQLARSLVIAKHLEEAAFSFLAFF